VALEMHVDRAAAASHVQQRRAVRNAVLREAPLKRLHLFGVILRPADEGPEPREIAVEPRRFRVQAVPTALKTA
jgi:hypothetical protein